MMKITRTWKRVLAAACAGVVAFSVAACDSNDAAIKKAETSSTSRRYLRRSLLRTGIL